MSNLIDKKMDIAASLWMSPCTLKELAKRFEVAEYGLHILVNSARQSGWIYEKPDETLYCYKKTVKQVLNPKGYELDLRDTKLSEFEKAYLKSKKILI